LYSRYVLKDRESGTVLFHVTFTLMQNQEESGSKKSESEIESKDDDVD
jgi:hypothetical protein